MSRLRSFAAFFKATVLPLPGQILLGAFYILVVCPYGFLYRRFATPGRFRPDPRRASYWKDRKPESPSMERARERF